MGVYDCACGGTRVCVCVHVHAFYVCVIDSVCMRARRLCMRMCGKVWQCVNVL